MWWPPYPCHHFLGSSGTLKGCNGDLTKQRNSYHLIMLVFDRGGRKVKSPGWGSTAFEIFRSPKLCQTLFWGVQAQLSNVERIDRLKGNDQHTKKFKLDLLQYCSNDTRFIHLVNMTFFICVLLRSAVGMTHDLRSDLWWTIPLRILLGHFGIP